MRSTFAVTMAILSVVYEAHNDRLRGYHQTRATAGPLATNAAQVKFISSHAKEKDYHSEGCLFAPPGYVYPHTQRTHSSTLPSSFKQDYSVHNRKYIAVVGGSEEGELTTVWVLNNRGKRIGRVAGLPSYTEYIDAKWDPKGSLLSLLCAGWSKESPHIALGVVEPGALRFRSVLRCDHWKLVNEALLWANRRVLMICHIDDKGRQMNTVIEINPTKHHWRRVYSRIENAQINFVDVSPDGTALAFDKDPIGVSAIGIWVINLQTGKCKQMTFEHNLGEHVPGIVESGSLLRCKFRRLSAPFAALRSQDQGLP